MKTNTILLLCFVGAALLSSTMANNAGGPNLCCFETYQRPIDPKRVNSYSLTDPRCAKKGVILLTQKRRTVCVDPDLPWAQRIMKIIDDRTF